jgi:hypothetical protein
MPPFFIRRRSALPLMAGLMVAQVVATFFVRRSNVELQQSVSAMQAAGWLAIPSGPAAESLSRWASALGGGLFYTLSVGALLALATWGILYLWQRLFAPRPWPLWIAAGAWAAMMAAVNWRGLAPFPTLLVAGIPTAVFLAAIQRTVVQRSTGRLWPLPLVTLALLSGLWLTQLDQRLFTAIRDHLLLNNAIGRTVNDFYYRYNLYAAQVFKSFEQKSLRTCRLVDPAESESLQPWVRLLADRDVVAAPGDPHPDLLIQITGDRVALISMAGDRIETERDAFFEDPDFWLNRYSGAADRHAPLRRLTFAGLLLGFPILLFVMVDGLTARLTGIFAGASAGIWWRCGICLALGILLLLPLLAGRVELTRQKAAEALTDDRWQVRVVAVRLLEREKMDLSAFPQYRRLLESPLIVERYYVARALGVSRTRDTFKDLLGLTGDPHPNVVCQAYSALGRRKQRAAVAPIMDRMVLSDHWYTQWYGYQSIRSLGWQQGR